MKIGVKAKCLVWPRAAGLVGVFLCALAAQGWAGAALELHVAPKGQDGNPGTAEKPFATLEKARDAVRAAKREGKLTQPVSVLLHGGNYFLKQPVVFTAEDSGTEACPITYQAAPGEAPVLHGGRFVKGWRQEGKFWVADLPEVESGEWRFRQLYVNGQERRRARIPNEGFLRVAAMPEGNPKTAHYHKSCQSFGFAAGDLNPKWSNLPEVEVIVYHFWTDSHLPIKSIDTRSNVVTFACKADKVFSDDFTTNGARYIVENVFEGLDAPGEWYLNRHTGKLYYLPMAGEDLTTAEVVAPWSPAHLRLDAEAAKRQFVEHVRFRNISFEYSHFELPRGDANSKQGAASVSATVTLRGARHVAFEHCRFSRLGGWAVELMSGCSENRFVGNELSQLAGGGIRVDGGTEKNPPLQRTFGNVFTDNLLAYYGQNYPSAVGILLMNTSGNEVAHNEIHHGWYTGISAGWVWGYAPSVSRDNRIEFNHIHDIGMGLLSDMGGIYTLGVSPGTVLRGNVIHDVDANQYGGWGIYHDEGSSHILDENNLVYRTKFAPFNIHYAKEITVRNNIFALGRLEQLSRTRMEPHRSVFFENNLVYWQTGELLTKNWKDEAYAYYYKPKMGPGPAGNSTNTTSTFEMNWNVYFNPTTPLEKVDFNGCTWEEWQKRGKDHNSLYADPLFVDAAHDDFRLKPESPALALGFRPFDARQAGPRGKAGPGANQVDKGRPGWSEHPSP